jgi:hypothetical protein
MDFRKMKFPMKQKNGWNSEYEKKGPIEVV